MAKKVLMKGNEAIAEAAIASGCLHFFGYPITPQTEIAAYMAKKLPLIGGTFLILDKCSVLKYIMAVIIRKFGDKKYLLMNLMIIIIMLVKLKLLLDILGLFQRVVKVEKMEDLHLNIGQ